MIIYKQILQKFGIEASLSKQDAMEMVLFTFKLTRSTDFTRWLLDRFDIDKRTAADLRMSMDANGYLMFHVKPCIWWAYKNRISDQSQWPSLAAEFELREDDTKLLRLLLDPEFRQHLKPLSEFRALKSSRLLQVCAEMHLELQPWTRRFVGKKMSFIFKNRHNGITHEDIVADCMAKGLQNLAMAYPRVLTRLHGINLMKRGIHNYGINYIQTMTRPARAMIYKDGEGFSSRVITLTDDHMTMLMAQPSTQHMDMLDKMALKSIKAKLRGRKKKALKLMCGVYDVGFSSWLQGANISVANDELWYQCHNRGKLTKYEDLVQDYVDVSDGQWADFKSQLATMIGA